MRKKPNLLPRMERCAALQIMTPERHRGRWLSDFAGFSGLWLEIGCGKGKFTVETAEAHPDKLILAIECVPEAMVVGMERALERGLTNIRFIDCDARRLAELFAPGEADRIYLNFSDPWPHARHAKRRLTAPGFLALYSAILSPDGEIRFKTDNAPLFHYSLEQFAGGGWAVSDVTEDLHAGGPAEIMTDYEAKFFADGVPICRCVAKLNRKEGENHG